MAIAAFGLHMGALFIWTPPGQTGMLPTLSPGDIEDFAGAAGADHLAESEGEPASVLPADVAGHFKRVLRVLSSWAARAGPRYLP